VGALVRPGVHRNVNCRIHISSFDCLGCQPLLIRIYYSFIIMSSIIFIIF
jgi:hypothetical protein